MTFLAWWKTWPKLKGFSVTSNDREEKTSRLESSATELFWFRIFWKSYCWLFRNPGRKPPAILGSFVLTFEWKRSSSENLLSDHNRSRILRLVQLKAVEVVGLAVICASFSMAIMPPVRSPRFPQGVPWASPVMKQKILEGNSHASFAVTLIETAEEHSLEKTHEWLPMWNHYKGCGVCANATGLMFRWGEITQCSRSRGLQLQNPIPKHLQTWLRWLVVHRLVGRRRSWTLPVAAEHLHCVLEKLQTQALGWTEVPGIFRWSLLRC